jgi:hypothetical protein
MILNDPQWSLKTSMTHNVHNEPLGASRSLQEPQWPQWPQSALMTAMRHEPQWVSMNLNDPQWPQWPSMTSNSLKEPQWSSMTSMTWMSLNEPQWQLQAGTRFHIFLVLLLLYRQLNYVSRYILFFRSRSPSTTSSSMGGQDFGSSKLFLHYAIPEIGHTEILLSKSIFNKTNKPSLKL